ncbi:MAG: ROK family protein [Candidatus Omnitrophica bacterium]|nr:ROK family protein [Candidatus Omnitrophota bacterium]
MARKKYTIGIDVGGTNLKIGLLNTEFVLKDKHVLNTRIFSKKEELIAAIAESAEKVIFANGLKKIDISGLGIGVPGPVNSDEGIVYFFPNIPGWKNVNLKKILEKKSGFRVCIDNDANLMALAEHRKGAARNSRNAVCLTLGTGVGGGIIIENRLFRGSSFVAGEIGHMPLNENGPRCNCGGIACLESYVGNNKIMDLSRNIFHKDYPLEYISSLARKGDQRAIKVWQYAGRHIGLALAGIVNLLNPDCIVIGGGVAEAGPVLFNSIRDTVKRRAMPVQAKHVKIVKAELGNNAGMIGAGLLVRESF